MCCVFKNNYYNGIFLTRGAFFFFFGLFDMQKEADGARSGECRVSVANSPQFQADSNVREIS